MAKQDRCVYRSCDPQCSANSARIWRRTPFWCTRRCSSPPYALGTPNFPQKPQEKWAQEIAGTDRTRSKPRDMKKGKTRVDRHKRTGKWFLLHTARAQAHAWLRISSLMSTPFKVTSSSFCCAVAAPLLLSSPIAQWVWRSAVSIQNNLVIGGS